MLNKVLKKYNGKPHIHGEYDCALMMFEVTGFDLSKIEPYSTLKGALKSLRKASGCLYPVDYVQSIGYKQISPLEASDGCLVIDGLHTGIFYNGCVFSLNAETKRFQFNQITLQEQLQMGVYKQWQS